MLQARALRDVTAAALWPRLDSLALAQRSKSGGNPAVNNFRAGFDASWELDIFGANRSALDASDATVQASAASLGDVQVSIAAEVALDYITLRGAQAQLAIAADNLASQLATLQMAQWRLQAGLIDGLESEQARASAEQTRARLPALQTGVEQVAHALAVLTGQPPAALAAVLATPTPVPQAAGDLVLAIPTETLRQRPDVRAAEHQVTAAAARVAQAEAARLPNFQLGGSLGLSALTLGALGSSAAVASALLASVSLPVFDGGALRAQVRAQQAALDAARVAYQATVLTALKDVEDALVALRGDRERLARPAARRGRGRQRRAAGAPALRQRADRFPDRARHPAHPARRSVQCGYHSALLLERRPCAPVQGARRRLASDGERSAPLSPSRVRHPRPPPLMNTPDPTLPHPPSPHPRPRPTTVVDLATCSPSPLRPAGTAAPRCGPGALALALAAGGLWWWQAARTANAAPSYSTQTVARGNLTLTVTANGTLQPTRSTSIGSELSGTVLKVNVDVNDRIRKGQVLVELDTAKLRDQILRSRAVLSAATAKVAQTVATVKEARASLARLEEVARLSGGKVPSETELDAAHAALERARADEASARAGVNDAQAALALDEINLSKASIRAPSDGVVLTRSVDPGNAVAASLQAVTLFTVAEDLALVAPAGVCRRGRCRLGGQGRPGGPASPSAPTRAGSTRRASPASASARPSPTTSSPTSPTWTWTTAT